jgi:hypothetical protein
MLLSRNFAAHIESGKLRFVGAFSSSALLLCVLACLLLL